jgi:hypothetical protein
MNGPQGANVLSAKKQGQGGRPLGETMRSRLAFMILAAGLALGGQVQAGPASITGSAMMDERVDLSIERGLAFLAANQAVDGSFGSIGVSGLCGMAFLAKGYLPGEDKYGSNIDRVIDHVLSNMDEKGIYGGQIEGGYMYSHGICTLFLTEVSGMVDAARQEKIDKLLPKAVQVILTAQGDGGGWDYQPVKGEHDLSISGWQLMALRSARLNGAAVPVKAIENAVKYVLNHNDPLAGTFGYSDRSANSVTLTGAGILCLELCGEHGNPVIATAGNYLMGVYEQLPAQGHAAYGLYYTAQGLFQIGGVKWQGFSKWMYDYWIPKQTPEGSFGDAYKTSMTLLAFSVPYRMLPIYQRDETVDEE